MGHPSPLSRTTRAALLAATALLAACAGGDYAPSREEERSDGVRVEPAADRDATPGQRPASGPTPATEPAGPVAAGPWQERPRTHETSGRPASRVRLAALGAAAERRPALPAAVKLGVAWTDPDRRLVHDGDALLRLESALEGEPAVGRVVALDPGPAEATWALRELCAAAGRQGLDLLLVEATGAGAAREASLIAVAERLLLDVVPSAAATPAALGPAPRGDLADRVAHAWRRTRS